MSLSLEIFGDRWSLLVIRDIMFSGRRRFRQLLKNSDERIASNILADRLQRLVDAGILTKDSTDGHAHAEYSLTEQGIALVPVFAAIDAWGIQYLPTTPPMAAPAGVVVDGGPAIQEQLMNELRAIHLGTQPLPPPEASVLRRMGEAASTASS